MGTLVTVGVNTLAFYIIAKILPGFRIKSEKTALVIAVAYSFLMVVASLLATPFMVIAGLILAVIAFIPVIGPLMAGTGALISIFLLTFGLTAALLIAIDKGLEDFEMDSTPVALIASFLLAVLSVVVRWLLPV